MSESMHEKLAYRLADMLTMLNMGEVLDVNELARKYQVSRRTIMRDIDERLLFLPLEKNKGKYRLSATYLGRLNFKDIRAFAQISGIAKLYPNLDTSFLREILDERATQVYSVKGYTFEDASQFSDIMDCIKRAIKEQKKLKFTYKDGERIVEPYQIVHHRGCWYLAAIKNGELKTYRLSRMSDLALDNADFVRNPAIAEKIESSESIWFGKEKIEVILKVKAVVASHFLSRSLLPEQQIIKKLEQGDLLISSNVVNAKQIFPLVRYWIPNIEIISPEGWQSELEEGLRGYLLGGIGKDKV